MLHAGEGGLEVRCYGHRPHLLVDVHYCVPAGDYWPVSTSLASWHDLVLLRKSSRLNMLISFLMSHKTSKPHFLAIWHKAVGLIFSSVISYPGYNFISVFPVSLHINLCAVLQLDTLFTSLSQDMRHPFHSRLYLEKEEWKN